MSIGYACLTVGVPSLKMRTCSLKNATPELLTELIGHNLAVLDRMLDYNIQNHIQLFRISSDIIPFGSHAVNTLAWWSLFAHQLADIGAKAMAHSVRLSMHPGQYTVLNSPSSDVVERAVEDLQYHCRFLDALGLGPAHKLILHIGGIYGDKPAAIQRFVEQYRCLDHSIHRRLVIENDDRQYTAADVLAIGLEEGIPVVFDNLHHHINRDDSRSELEWISACAPTWKAEDGPQKLHYSQQADGKRIGSHSGTVDAQIFVDFYSRLPQPQPDIMLEVKDKNLSALKCIACTGPPKIAVLEGEWSRYKYLLLEHSPTAYLNIRELLKDKNTYPAVKFYGLIDEALAMVPSAGNMINAAQHVWGYVKDYATDKEKAAFQRHLERITAGASPLPLKRQLLKLAQLYGQEYLLPSLYFWELHS